MNTSQLECFLAVADALSFARAAERLHLTQPSVTHQIRSLEQELGCTLFNRTTRRVSLTEEGRTLIPDAESMLGIARRALTRYRAAEGSTRPTRLSVGSRSFAHAAFVAKAFRQLASEVPGLHPDLVVTPHDHLHQLLEDGEVDVVLDFEGAGRRGEAYTSLCGARVECLLPEDSPLAGRTSLLECDLEGQPIAIPKPACIPRQMHEAFFRIVSQCPMSDRYLCDSMEATRLVTLSGLAIAIAPVPDNVVGVSVPEEPALPMATLENMPEVTFGAYVLGNEKRGLVTRLIELVQEG